MSIYFNIPAGTYNGRAVSARTVKVDRGFSETNSIRVRESTLEDFPFQHIKVHDINERNTDIKLTLNIKTESEYLDILKYFESLKGCKAITLRYPDPIEYYGNNYNTLWFNFNDTTSMRVGRDGSGGAPGVGDSVGLVVDTSVCAGAPLEEYMSTQPELITNGTFDTDTTGWTAGSGATLSSVSGQLNVTCTAPDDLALTWQEIPTVVGKWYEVSVTKVSQDFNSAWGLTTNNPWEARDVLNFGASITGTATGIFKATATTTYISLWAASDTVSNGTTIYDNVSVKALPGYCFVSDDDLNRPTLQYDGSRHYLDFDITDNLQAPGSDMSSLGYEVSRATFAKNMVQEGSFHIWFAPDLASLYVVASNDGSTNTTLSAFAGGNIGYDTSDDFGLYIDGVETTFADRNAAHDAVRGLNKTVWADGVDTATYAAWTNNNWTIGSEYNSTWAMDGTVYNWFYTSTRVEENKIAEISDVMSNTVLSKKIIITQWSTSIQKGGYGNLNVSGELVY